jgi:hypothetical protein
LPGIGLAPGHRDAQFLLRDRRRVFTDDPAFVENEDSIGECKNFVEREREGVRAICLTIRSTL